MRLSILAPAAVVAMGVCNGAAADATSRDVVSTGIGISAVTTEYDNLDTAVNLGFTIGLHAPPIGRTLAAEIELSSTLIPGENSGGDFLGGGGRRTASSADLRLNTAGVFVAARTPGDVFALARGGYRFVDSTIDELQQERSGAAFGAGIGYAYGPLASIELQYTQYTDDAAFLTLAFYY